MRIQHVSEPPHFHAQCLTCEKTIPNGEKYADLDGPPFQAYYHRQCLPPTEAILPDPSTVEWEETP